MEMEVGCTGLRVQRDAGEDEKTLRGKSLLVNEPSAIRAGGVADGEAGTIEVERIPTAVVLRFAVWVFKGGRYVSRDYGDSDA
jgi:hypothetical protein